VTSVSVESMKRMAPPAARSCNNPADHGIENYFNAESLPRLLVISNTNIEATASGALALFRLFQEYPPEKLMVFGRPPSSWAHEVVRIAGAKYRDIGFPIPRAVLMRFNPFWPVAMASYVRSWTSQILSAAKSFRPQAVFTVAEAFHCFLADSVARKLSVPLHVVVHDDWTYHQVLRHSAWTKPAARWACDRAMGAVLRKAATRFVVSPGMREEFQSRYQTTFDVLYPSRGEDSPLPKLRAQAVPEGSGPVYAYAGTIHHQWVINSLRTMGEILGAKGGRLDLYVPYPVSQLDAWGLSSPSVQLAGFFPPSVLADAISSTAHGLFLPASFNAAQKMDVSTLFPSKLVDYTAIGLPVLAWGPTYSSIARWAAENPGAVELVTEKDASALEAAIERLRAGEYARSVAAAGMAAGERYFEAGTVRRQFYSRLCEFNQTGLHQR
jgi:hypothetical protein